MKSLTLALTLMAGSVALLPAPAHAADETWNGGSGAWNSSNWSPDGVPPGAPLTPGTITSGTIDAATFNTDAGSSPIITVDADWNIRNINFNAGAGSFTFSGGPLVLSASSGYGGGTIALNSGVTGGQTVTFNTPLILVGNYSGYTIANNSTDSTFVINGSISVTGDIGTYPGSLGGNNAPYGVTLFLDGNNTGSNTINGVITNGFSNAGVAITKNGTGNWILNAANTTAGDTAINNGTLELANTNALQYSNVGINVADGLTFSSTGTYVVKALGGNSTESLASGTRLQVGLDGAAYKYNSGTTYTSNATFSGAGGLDVRNFNSTTQAFTTLNTYSGGTRVYSGTLKATSSVSGTPFGTGALTMYNGILSLAPTGSGSDIVYNVASGAPGTQFTYGGGTTVSLNKGSQNSVTLTAGNAGETGSALNRVNNGTLIIQPTSTDLGSGENFTVNGTAPLVTNGMVNASIVGYGVTAANVGDFLTYGPNGFTSAAGSYTPRSGTLSAGTTSATEISNFNGAANLTGDNTTYAVLVQQNQNVSLNSGVTLNVGDNTAGHQAGIILNGGNASITGGTLNFGASEGIIYAMNSPATYYVASINSKITGTGGLTVSGSAGAPGNANLLQFNSSNNTFSGGLTLDAGVTLLYPGGSANNSQFVNGTFGDPNNVITFNGGTLDVNGPYGTTGAYVGVGRSFVLNEGGGTLLGNNNYVANISGTGTLSIGNFNEYGSSPSNYGNNFTVLSGNNTYTGGTTLRSGYTVIASDANIGGADSKITFDGGFLSIAGTTIHNLDSHQLNFIPGSGVGFDIQNANNTVTLSQSISQGRGDLYKTGQGTLVLTGANTYYGYTDVYAGTLKVDASQGGSISYGSSLFFDGGTLYILGSASGATTQSFNSVIMGINRSTSDATSGGGTLVVDSNMGDGSQSVTVSLGNLQTGNGPNGDGNNGSGSTGGSLNIVAKGNGTVNILTSTNPDGTTGLTGSTGIYGGRIVYTDASGVSNWATSNDFGPTYSITGYTDYIAFNSDNGNGDPGNMDNTQLTGNSTLSGDTTVNSLKINNSVSATMNLNGNTLSLNSGGLLFTGSTNYTISNGTLVSNLTGRAQTGDSSPGTDLIIQQYSNSTLTISAVIANNGSVNSTLTKAGPGTLILTAANTYTGQTFINGGTIQIASANNISAAALNLNGGTLQYNPTVTGDMLITPNVYFGANGGGFDALNGGIIKIPAVYTFVGNGNIGPGAITVNSSDESGGVVWLDYTSNLGGNRFYGGINLLGGTLRLGSYGGVGDTADLGTNPANYVSWSDTSHGILQLNGVAALVSGLSSLSPDAVVENGNGSNTNVLLGVSTGDDETYAGTLVNTLTTGTGTLGFFKTGAGTLSLTNTNSSYTGKTEIDGGILNVALITDGGNNSSIGASSNAAANIAFGGGTLQYTGSTAQSTDRLFTLGDAGNIFNTSNTGVGGNSGTIDASGSSPSATVSFTNSGALAYGNVGTHSLTFTGTNTGLNSFAPLIGDSSSPTSVSKTGTGTWVLTNANTYSGGTSVTAGTLYVNNGSGSGLGTGSVAVSSTGTLAGTGTIQPGGTNALLVSAGGTIAPGGVQPVVPYGGISGTTANGNLTLDTTNITAGSTVASFTNAKLTFTLGAGDTSSGSKLVITGGVANTLAFGGTSYVTINDLVGSDLVIGDRYVLIVGDNTTFSGLTVDGTGLITSGLQMLYDNTPGNSYFSDFFRGSQLYVEGDNIVLDVVPEPSTWALMIGGLVMLFFVRRRRTAQTRA